MTSPMNQSNGLISLSNLLATSLLEVPPYQRAYAWDEKPHVHDFFEDLAAHPATQESRYFLGTILLTMANGDVDARFRLQAVVDGQQRLTTACILVAAAVTRLSGLGASSNL